MVKVRIGGGEADPRSVPMGHFTPEPREFCVLLFSAATVNHCLGCGCVL
jgi:hypothetical protein